MNDRIGDDELRDALAQVAQEAKEAEEDRQPSTAERDALLLARAEAEAEEIDEWRQQEFMKEVNDWADDYARAGCPIDLPYHIWRGTQAARDAFMVRAYRRDHKAAEPPALPTYSAPAPVVPKPLPRLRANSSPGLNFIPPAGPARGFALPPGGLIPLRPPEGLPWPDSNRRRLRSR